MPQVRFAVAAFKPHQAQLARAAVAESGLPIEVLVGRTPELIRLADCCLAVSGSVSLELLYHAKPTAVLYWISPLAYAVQKRFRRVKYITLVNLLTGGDLFPADTTPYDPDSPEADSVLFPEYLTCQDRSPQLAKHIVTWLTDAPARRQLVQRLQQLAAEVGHGGAASTAAEYILERRPQTPAVLPPHYVPRAAQQEAASHEMLPSAAA